MFLSNVASGLEEYWRVLEEFLSEWKHLLSSKLNESPSSKYALKPIRKWLEEGKRISLDKKQERTYVQKVRDVKYDPLKLRLSDRNRTCSCSFNTNLNHLFTCRLQIKHLTFLPCLPIIELILRIGRLAINQSIINHSFTALLTLCRDSSLLKC